MRFFRRTVLTLVAIGIAGAGAGWYLAGREAGPSITIKSPDQFVGRASALDVVAESATPVVAMHATLEQNGQSTMVASYGSDGTGQTQVSLSGALGKTTIPTLVSGPATLTVTASRQVFFGLRTAESAITRELQVRLDPPRIAVTSIHHFINLGGAEFVVLRATPDDVDAGVRVGDVEYRAYPGSAVGIADPAVRVAFFALKHDQDVNVRMSAFARDAAGNEVTTPLEHQPTNKKFLQSRIPIDQRFLDRVVPAIASNTPGLKVDVDSPEGLLKGFLTINGDLRKQNGDTITALAAKSQPKMLWTEAFAQMGNSQVESRFADRRTYFFGDQEIDRQVHLGFDLASVQQAPVNASNAGVVVFADFLGIYGNCVIVDHGLGVQSLYAHLSSIGTKVGDTVAKGQELGRTGATGLAGGDHLHFTILLQGVPVNPIEFWDPQWMRDRVLRKINEAGGTR
ncbi:MAG: Stage sporulation protein [Acidobacteriota bacterium]|jgi:murein DD-endopeptidase MepM/ murein hydrolase activator NlpD